MKLHLLPAVVFITLVLTAPAADQVETRLRPNPAGVELEIQATFDLPVADQYPEFSLLFSTNLLQWLPTPEIVAGEPGVSEDTHRVPVASAGTHGFYQVVGQVKRAESPGRLGHAVYGYGTELSRQLRTVGQLPLDDFVALYNPTNAYLSALTFNPTNADYWTNFVAAGLQLDSNELPRFQTNGFVVSQRLGHYSFARSFYRIFVADLPVYLSSDAILHAWHRSYLGMLEELEESSLAPKLETVLSGMAAEVPTLWSQSTSTALVDGVRDADYFIAVARSLLSGTNDYGSLGQGARVLTTLTAISNLQPADISLFGTTRTVDFSQFQVRGHYETSGRLARYFRATMWCALADFRFTGATNDNSLRELSGAVAMHLLLQNSAQFNNWKQIDDVVQMFVGPPDSLNFAQLSDLMTAAGVSTPASLPDLAALQALQNQFLSGQVGVQSIQSGYFWSPLSREQLKLPRSFTVLGQRFTPDAWIMGQCVFDRIIWDADGIPSLGDKVMRRVPSSLDVAFSVFGNSQTVPLLAARIANTNGHPWRDGLPYQHNLAALRNVMDLQEEAAWTNNIYTSWLWALRGLSEPTTAAEYPDALRTRPWAMKTLNTQLASWTQLRHDTVLYAKQPYSANLVCSYPEGFIEPRVVFWERMRTLALRARSLLATLPNTGTLTLEPNYPLDPFEPPFTVSLGTLYTNRLAFLDNFAARMTTLRDISVKELNRQPLDTNEVFFIESLIENPHGYAGYPQYSGWYPGLVYVNARAAVGGSYSTYSSIDLWDALVTDVHTDPADPIVGDPGSILHQAVGNADLLIVGINWGQNDACVYAGPVLSHYEFELGPTTRRTDAEWKAQLKAGQAPPSPEWTQSYLVPGSITYPDP